MYCHFIFLDFAPHILYMIMFCCFIVFHSQKVYVQFSTFAFSGCGPSKLSQDHLAALKHFFEEEKKGIFLWGDDDVWLCEANQVGTHLLNTQVVWNRDQGGQVASF